MKTVLVTFGVNQEKLAKRYAFNTSEDLKVGDVINSATYTTNLEVVKVLDINYKYFNRVTGELSDVFNNSNQYEIKELRLRNDDAEVVYGVKVN
jgi:hypothetical protein